MAIDQKYPCHSIPAEEAKLRLEEIGPNELTGTEGMNPVLLFLKQFKDFLILILAAGVAWYADHMVEVYVILGVIMFNAVLGFFQGYRAEKAIQTLRSMIKQQATVLRGGKAKKVEARELVPGGVILLEEGDSIPADARVLHANNLQTIEASFTAESLPIAKEVAPLAEKINLGDRTNMLRKGTHVARGTARAVVAATGPHTELGKISTSVGDM